MKNLQSMMPQFYKKNHCVVVVVLQYNFLITIDSQASFLYRKYYKMLSQILFITLDAISL